MVRRYYRDPFEYIARLFDEFENRFFENFERHFPMLPEEERLRRPAVDIQETEESYEIDCDMPGVDKKDIEITVEDNRLVISAETKSEEEEEKGGFLRRERRYSGYKRVLELPVDADIDKIDAEYKNGVLRIKVPKLEEAKKRTKKIEIR
mgnify:CR=1 FL=1